MINPYVEERVENFQYKYRRGKSTTDYIIFGLRQNSTNSEKTRMPVDNEQTYNSVESTSL